MAATSPTRIDEDLFAAAKRVAPVMSRSAAQQINHWARIGRELEAARSVSHRAIDEVLEGARHYDDLNAYEQAITRAEWSERTAATLASLHLAAKFARQGRPYVELDHAGKVARREPRIAD